MRRSIKQMALIAATVIMTIATNAQAEGALVVGIANNNPANGLSYGLAHNYPSAGEAKYQALLTCLTTGSEPMPEVRAACRLATEFSNQCLTVAWDPQPGQPGWGWAVNTDQKAAERAAIDKCRATSTSARASSCVVERSVCDTVGSGAPKIATGPSSVELVSMTAPPPAESSGGARSAKR